MASKSESHTPRGWVSFKDAATYAGVSPRIISDWVSDGLRCVEYNRKTKLIKLVWIDAFLEEQSSVNDPAMLKQIVKTAMGRNKNSRKG